MRTFKNLLAILLGGFLVFQTLAIVQEWEVFGAAWFGLGDEPEEGLSADEREAAADAVYLALSLQRHFYASGGDPRFADRMPVSEAILAEMQSELAYLARNGRIEDPVLDRLEILSVQPAGPRRATVRTRERWTVQLHRASDRGPIGKPSIGVTDREYLVALEGDDWRVMGWDLASSTEAEDSEETPTPDKARASESGTGA